MSAHFPLSRHQHHRLIGLGQRLQAILFYLDALTARRTPLPRTVAGPALRTVSEARILSMLPPHGLRAKGLMPGELFAETLLTLDYLAGLKRLQFQASPEFEEKSYPRASGQE
ncbi:MAG: hypothetical protein ABIY37_13700 [Devosia sp.]